MFTPMTDKPRPHGDPIAKLIEGTPVPVSDVVEELRLQAIEDLTKEVASGRIDVETSVDRFKQLLTGVPVELSNPFNEPPQPDEARYTYTVYIGDDEKTLTPEHLARALGVAGFTMWHTWGGWMGTVENGWAIEVQGDWSHVDKVLRTINQVLPNEDYAHVRQSNIFGVEVRYVNLHLYEEVS